jgi:hypothetical protein
MSEKMYTRLLRLYPSSFRRLYEGEALQLVRDRLRDETGFFKRARLWWDLIADVLTGLTQAYRNSYAATEAASLSLNVEGVPSFKVLDKEPLERGSIVVGSTLSLAVLGVFGFVLSHPIAYQPLSGSNGRMSPIESVMQRLNQSGAPDSAVGEDQGAAVSASTAQSSAASASTPNTTSSSEKTNLESEGDGAVPSRMTNVNDHSSNLEKAPGTREGLSNGDKQRDLATRGQSHAARLAADVAKGGRDSHTVTEHGHTPIHPGHPGQPGQPGQPRLEDAASAMTQLFQTHDIVMFGEVHDNEQEYEWLCKLVKTPEFADHVDDIVVEFGNALYQKTVDRYVAGDDVPFDEVQQAWRNMVTDIEPVSPVYGWLYKAVREANMQRQGKRGIRLVMGSPAGDWSKIKKSADLAPYESKRERWYAQVVKTQVLAKHRRALLIMGAAHFLRGHDQAIQYELAMEQHRDVPLDKAHLGPGYIERELRAAGARPYLIVFGTNAIDNHGDVDARFDLWPAPVITPLSGNWVGALPAQPVISGGHAPALPLTLADQADALLYVAPCSVLRTVYLSHAELDGTAYEREMIQRDIIQLGHPLTFSYGALPQCVQPEQASR